jgi:ABC-2 type transport system ATP-binding protein
VRQNKPDEPKYTYKSNPHRRVKKCYSIDIQNLTKRFEDKTAVDDLTLTINAGEIFGLLGPNGAGKTVTIKTLYGILKHTSGTARVTTST